MNRIPVSSQGILEVGYHEDADSRGTLELKFSNGGVYEFFNVPTKMYDEFMHAPSREDYYRENIGKRFPCTRVGSTQPKPRTGTWSQRCSTCVTKRLRMR